MTEQQMTPHQALSFLCSAIRCGEAFDGHHSQAAEIIRAALSHAERREFQTEQDLISFLDGLYETAESDSSALTGQKWVAAQRAIEGIRSHAEGEAVTFMRTWKSEPIYTCNKPGDMSGTYYPVPQVAVPEGLRERCREITEWHRTGVVEQNGALAALAETLTNHGESHRMRQAEIKTANEAMYLLAAAPTAPAGEPEFYVEHKTLRSAMAYVGIAAPESDEELGAEMERHTKRVIRAAAKLMTQFENARNLLRAGKEGETS